MRSIALICCRHRLRMCSRRCSCDGKSSCVSPALGWNAALTVPLTVLIDHRMTTMQRQDLVGWHDFRLGCEVVISDVCSDANCSKMFKTTLSSLPFHNTRFHEVIFKERNKMCHDCICKNEFTFLSMTHFKSLIFVRFLKPLFRDGYQQIKVLVSVIIKIPWKKMCFQCHLLNVKRKTTQLWESLRRKTIKVPLGSMRCVENCFHLVRSE